MQCLATIPPSFFFSKFQLGIDEWDAAQRSTNVFDYQLPSNDLALPCALVLPIDTGTALNIVPLTLSNTISLYQSQERNHHPTRPLFHLNGSSSFLLSLFSLCTDVLYRMGTFNTNQALLPNNLTGSAPVNPSIQSAQYHVVSNASTTQSLTQPPSPCCRFTNNKSVVLRRQC